MKRLANTSDERSELDQSVEFRKFITEKRADAKRDLERLASEIDTLQAQINSKIREQEEQADIEARCEAYLTLEIKANIPAPTLTERKDEQQ